jgi:hypothetical protein
MTWGETATRNFESNGQAKKQSSCLGWFNKSGMKTVFAKMTVYDEKV